MKIKCLTLTTDFGLKDNYVGILKGIIKSISVTTPVIDLTHHISPQNLIEAACSIHSAYHFFPKHTLHIVIVDPASSLGHCVLIKTAHHFFIAPDNGVLSLIMDHSDVCIIKKIALNDTSLNDEYQIARLAVNLACGKILFKDIGKKTESLKKLNLSFCDPAKDDSPPRILFSDHFGNLVTNIPNTSLGEKSKWCLVVNDSLTLAHHAHYKDVSLHHPFIFKGSYGLIEICIRNGSARNEFGMNATMTVKKIKKT